MQINWNDKRNKGTQESEMFQGDYQNMLKERKNKLPEMQDAIQNVLKDWDGSSIAIVVMKEDENGLPEGAHSMMTGVSRAEMQVAMGKQLNMMSEEVMHMIVEAVKDDPKAMIEIVKMVTKLIEQEENK